jgi:hypothetical protein
MIPVAKEPGIWWVRIITSGMLLSLIFVYWWIRNRKDMAPDFFAGVPQFFEKNGFAFLVGTEVVDNTCYLLVTFQNRYQRACEASVLVRTSERLLAPQRHLPDARISISCGPAAFGKVCIPWPIPARLQGKNVLVDVTARTKYPQGRGKMLRYRVGLEVGTAPGSIVFDLIKPLGVLIGVHGGTAARTELSLPENVASTPIVPTEKHERVIWKLGDEVMPPICHEAV